MSKLNLSQNLRSLEISLRNLNDNLDYETLTKSIKSLPYIESFKLEKIQAKTEYETNLAYTIFFNGISQIKTLKYVELNGFQNKIMIKNNYLFISGVENDFLNFNNIQNALEAFPRTEILELFFSNCQFSLRDNYQFFWKGISKLSKLETLKIELRSSKILQIAKLRN